MKSKHYVTTLSFPSPPLSSSIASHHLKKFTLRHISLCSHSTYSVQSSISHIFSHFFSCFTPCSRHSLSALWHTLTNLAAQAALLLSSSTAALPVAGRGWWPFATYGGWSRPMVAVRGPWWPWLVFARHSILHQVVHLARDR